MMNCLEYALNFWHKNREYTLFYNNDHVVNLPRGTKVEGFYPLEQESYSFYLNAFQELISNEAKEILLEYYQHENMVKLKLICV